MIKSRRMCDGIVGDQYWYLPPRYFWDRMERIDASDSRHFRSVAERSSEANSKG